MSYDEHRIAEALRALPPAPHTWVRAAQELPSLNRAIDAIVERAQRDPEFRNKTLADLEAALLAEGHEPEPALIAALRHRLHPD
jgi:hypothetical protein